MNLRNHRDDILQALTLALDACLDASERYEPLAQTEPLHFVASLNFAFTGTTERIVSAPALDFTRPLAPQLKTAAIQL